MIRRREALRFPATPWDIIINGYIYLAISVSYHLNGENAIFDLLIAMSFPWRAFQKLGEEGYFRNSSYLPVFCSVRGAELQIMI